MVRKENNGFVIVTRPDGSKLHLNIAQIIYVTNDPVDETKKKTEIVTTQGAFIINKPLDDVLAVLYGNKSGEL